MMIQGYSELNHAHEEMLKNALGEHAKHIPLYERYADARAYIERQQAQQYADQQIQKVVKQMTATVNIDDKSMKEAENKISTFIKGILTKFGK